MEQRPRDEVFFMHLKRLELFGFKSFPDRVTLDFGPGITAIVGPNGCGKTNLADAVRWVLGETRSRSLRAGSMAEVIFSGTDTRKPLSMAEVTLVLEGDDAAGGYGEIAITRKVFASGESQYFINKVPCRLRDIVDLFADTGLGRPSYSFFEQGGIDAILLSKPTERRAIFEEAAGITKYRLRKEEAMRKLAATEANLARVGDIIAEVRRQTISLARQAGKARRYREYSEELRELELGLACGKWRSLSAQVVSLEEEFAQAREELARVSAEQAGIEALLEERRSALLRSEEELAALGRKRAEAALEAGRVEGQIKALEEKAEVLLASAQREDAQAVALREEASRLEAEAAELESRSQGVTAAAAQAAEALSAAEAQVASISSDIEEARARAEEIRTRLLDVASRRAGAANEKEARAAAAAGAAASVARLTARREELSRLLEGARARLSEESRALQDADAGCGALQERMARLTAERSAAVAALAEATSRVERLSAESSAARASLDALLRMAKAFEGYGAGARALLTADDRPDGVLGALAERMEVAGEYSAAVEAALGSKVQAVLLAGEDALLEAARFLRGKGRATMLLPGWRRPAAVPEGVRTVAGLVSCEEAVRPLVDALLGSVLYAPSLAEALALVRDTGLPAVTPAGELVEPSGAVTAGGRGEQAGGEGEGDVSVLRRSEAIARCRERVRRLDEQLEAARRVRAEAEERLSALERGLACAREEHREATVLVARAQERVRELEEACSRLEREATVVAEELAQLGQTERDLLETVSRLERSEHDLAAEEDSVRASLRTVEAQLAELEWRRVDAEALLAQRRVEAAELRERGKAARAQVAALRARAESALAKAAEREAAAAASRDAARKARDEAAALRERLADLVAREDADRRAMAQAERVLEELRGQVGELEAKVRRARTAHEEATERVHGVELALAEARARLSALVERMRERYEVDIAEEAASRPPLEDEEGAEARAAQLREKLEKMGPVNMVAVEEHEELERRYNFLVEQREDLLRAKADLLKVIQEANRVSRERFLSTFEEISRNFETLFERLFGGGRAYLQLVESDDVLESGVHIVARPPGKRPQSINLLSGGERALTAIALMFAMFMVKPAPFCILDEIDAPLDEANVDRFTALLEELSSRSQFIIITHNKRTMRKADVLYGVTMEEKGCSRIVSVKIAEEREGVHDREAGEPAVQNA